MASTCQDINDTLRRIALTGRLDVPGIDALIPVRAGAAKAERAVLA